MDDLKLFPKSGKLMDIFVRTAHVFSTDIEIEFGMKKCGIFTMKRKKLVKYEGRKLLSCKVMKEVEKK